MTSNIQWGRGPLFAEAAEALQLNTGQIMAMVEHGTLHVFFSNESDFGEDDDNRIFLATLLRDEDGILRPTGPPVEQTGMFEEMREGLREHMEKTFGQGKENGSD